MKITPATLCSVAAALALATIACERRAAAGISYGKTCLNGCVSTACASRPNCVAATSGTPCISAGASITGVVGKYKTTCGGTIGECTFTTNTLCTTTFNCYCTRSGADYVCIVGGSEVSSTNESDCEIKPPKE